MALVHFDLELNCLLQIISVRLKTVEKSSVLLKCTQLFLRYELAYAVCFINGIHVPRAKIQYFMLFSLFFFHKYKFISYVKVKSNNMYHILGTA